MTEQLDQQGPSYEPDVPGRILTTFQLGGPCRGLIDCQSPDALPPAVEYLSRTDRPFMVIGGGSNLLISDTGPEGFLVRLAHKKPLWEESEEGIRVSGGTRLSDLVQQAVEKGWGGFVHCAGIPGTVGGAIAGNAGAFGESLVDVLTSITVCDAAGCISTRRSSDVEFTYRDSDLRADRQTVLWATFERRPTDPERLTARYDEIMDLRRSRHPDWKATPCAGSFFKNIEPTSRAERRQAAGWFLEQAGAKTMNEGGAAVFEKHANIIIKKQPDCTASDVYRLSRRMAEAVKEQFGLKLEREVQLVGAFLSDDAI